MAVKVEAFRLSGRVEVENKRARTELRATERDAKAVAESFKGLKGEVGSLRSSLSRGGGFLPGLAQISEVIQGIPQIGRLAGALVSPLTDAAEAGIRFNSFLETSEIAMKRHFGGSRDIARGFVNEIRDFAGKSPFRTEGLIKTVIYGTATGFSPREALALVKDVGDAIASTGEISEETVQGVVRALSQIKAKGTVSAEEMEQLAERGIPAWEMLAHSIGKSVAQTRKLAEQGKLNGPAAVTALRAEMRARYGGMMDELQSTLTGRLSAAQDAVQSATAKAMAGTTKNISDTLAEGLNRAGLVDSLAGTINGVLTPVSGLIKATASGLLGGGITSGLAEGVDATLSVVTGAVSNVGFKAILALADAIGARSPARKFIPYGRYAMQGFAQGVEQEEAETVRRFREAMDRIAAEFQRITGRRLPGLIGQTATHTRLGFDHSQGADIALVPGSRDADLVERLAALEGLPVLRQPGARRNRRGRVTSTGAHLHLGRLSPNLDRTDAHVVSEASATPGMQAGTPAPVPVQIVGGYGDLGRMLPKTPVYENGKLVGYDSADPEDDLRKTAEVVHEVNASFEPLVASANQVAGAEAIHFHRTQQLTQATERQTVAAGEFAATVIGSAKKMDSAMSAFGQIAGMLPGGGGQVGKKRGFFSKMLGFAAPFLNFIPGVGPILSTLASIGSGALAGDWSSVVSGAAAGFSSGGAFRGSGSGSSSSGGARASLNPSHYGHGGTLQGAMALGGPVRRGGAYLVGEHRPEVVELSQGSYVHPSIDTYLSRRGGEQGGGGAWGGMTASVMERLLAAVERINSASPGSVFVAGARSSDGQRAVTDAFMRRGAQDPRVVEWMQRRVLQPA